VLWPTFLLVQSVSDADPLVAVVPWRTGPWAAARRLAPFEPLFFLF
jgi:hypothetical protein